MHQFKYLNQHHQKNDFNIKVMKKIGQGKT